MTEAKEIMRPAAAVLAVDRPATEAVAAARSAGGGFVVVVDGGRVTGVLDPALLSEGDLDPATIAGYQLGSLVSLTYRTCIPDAEAGGLGEVFERSGATAIVVVGKDGVEGVIAPWDLPGAVR